MSINSLYTFFKSANGITTDSRNCPQNSLFFALKGESFDGNKYAASALKKGCSYAVVDDASVAINKQYILVDDVLSALQKLANHHRNVLALPIIGITGSNGKTTTKELLAAVLNQKFNLHYTQGNFNNHIGVPLTLLQLNESHEMAIVEMGANHPGEIAELCAIAQPNMGVITNIGKAHLEGFGGMDGVINTKKELYEYVRSNNGKVFVNGEDTLLMSLSDGIDRICYNSTNSSYRVNVAGAIPTLTLNVKSEENNDTLQTQIVGEYNCINIAVALEIGHYFDISYSKMKQALEAYTPTNNRSQIVKTANNTIVLDAYNANPASMAVAINNFTTLDLPHKTVILGAMKELGKYSNDEHQALIKAISTSTFEKKMVVGNEFCCTTNKPDDVLFFNSIDEIKNFLTDQQITDSTILVKGSRSMQMETLVELL